mgnify:FL=1|jgi:hypothetical protein
MSTRIELNRKTEIGIKQLDIWLYQQSWEGGMTDAFIQECRIILSNILERGYYDSIDRDILNSIRQRYIEATQK